MIHLPSIRGVALLAALTLTALPLVLLGTAHAQITVDGTFNASGSDKLVVVLTGEHGFNNDTGDVTSVTYDGVALTRAIDRNAQIPEEADQCPVPLFPSSLAPPRSPSGIKMDRERSLI